jgi:hypothetical protein
VWCATDASAWLGLGIQLAGVVSEKRVSALPATNTLANFGWQGPTNDEPQNFRETTSSFSASLQSAWRGGGGSASCNARTIGGRFVGGDEFARS